MTREGTIVNAVNACQIEERRRFFRRMVVTAIILLAIMPVIMPIMPVLATGAATTGADMFNKTLPIIRMFMRVLGIGALALGGVQLIWSFMDGNPAGQKPALVMILAGAFLFGLQLTIANLQLGTLIDT